MTVPLRAALYLRVSTARQGEAYLACWFDGHRDKVFYRQESKMARRQYTREFKLEAVRLIKERGVSVIQVARDLDVGEGLLRRWAREVSGDPQHSFPGQGQMKPEQMEIERLRREVSKLKAERDIPKKAAAYFAREST